MDSTSKITFTTYPCLSLSKANSRQVAPTSDIYYRNVVISPSNIDKSLQYADKYSSSLQDIALATKIIIAFSPDYSKFKVSTGSVVRISCKKAMIDGIITANYLGTNSLFYVATDPIKALEVAKEIVSATDLFSKSHKIVALNAVALKVDANEAVEKQRIERLDKFEESNDDFTEWFERTLLYFTFLNYPLSSKTKYTLLRVENLIDKEWLENISRTSGLLFYIATSMVSKQEFNREVFDKCSLPNNQASYFGKLHSVGNTLVAQQISANGSGGAIVFNKKMQPIGLNLEQNLFNEFQIESGFNFNLILPFANSSFLNCFSELLNFSKVRTKLETAVIKY